MGGLAALLAGVLLLFFLLPPLALTLRWAGFGLPSLASVSTAAVLAATGLSLATSALAMLIVVVLGTALAYLMAHAEFPLKRLLTVFVELPIVMPPAVAGLALLAAFGRQGLLGGLLLRAGVRVELTPLAVILAQVFVAAPYYIRAVQSRFSAVPRELRDAADIDGAGRWRTFPQRHPAAQPPGALVRPDPDLGASAGESGPRSWWPAACPARPRP